MQRQLGESSAIVMEGRDIGTKVFPHAAGQDFSRCRRRGARPAPLSAEWAGGARRRAESVLQELRERDRRDRTRAESPLQPAADAVIIDSTHLSLDEVVATGRVHHH